MHISMRPYRALQAVHDLFQIAFDYFFYAVVNILGVERPSVVLHDAVSDVQPRVFLDYAAEQPGLIAFDENCFLRMFYYISQPCCWERTNEYCLQKVDPYALFV